MIIPVLREYHLAYFANIENKLIGKYIKKNFIAEKCFCFD